MNTYLKKIPVLCAVLLCMTSCGNDAANSSSSAQPEADITSSIQDTNMQDSITSQAAAVTGMDEADTNAVTASGGESDEIFEIDDRAFTAMISDIYANTDNYMGKTIKLSGMFDIYHDNATGKNYYSVYRYDTAGCCSTGLEVYWDDTLDYPSPKQDEYVTAVGVLDQYEENGQQYLTLHLSELSIITQ